MLHRRRLAILAVLIAITTAATTSPAVPVRAAWDPLISEPTLPYPQPADADVPRRGCTTTVTDPANPPAAGLHAVQIIYAWHEGNGNNYTRYAESIAKIVDRIDWLLDAATDHDQHLNLSCRSGFGTATYAGYAQSLVVPEKIEAGNRTGETDLGVITADLEAAGYLDANRYYLVFEDFDGQAVAQMGCAGCVATVDGWDSGTAGHELFHVLGADHAWSTEDGGGYHADIMLGQTDYWMIDQDFNTYYDPSEPATQFYRNPYDDTTRTNIAAHPALTTPVCCDIGFSNDLLTAQERTVEADPPWSYPTGFTVSGGGWIQVTPPGPVPAVSARYYDGRRSLTMNVQPHAEGAVSLSRRVTVEPGVRHRFFARLATTTAGTVRLRMSWYNASGTLLSASTGPAVAITTGWEEYSATAVAPAAAARVQLSVVSPAGQSFAYQLDSLQLNSCKNTAYTPDGCRTPV